MKLKKQMTFLAATLCAAVLITGCNQQNAANTGGGPYAQYVTLGEYKDLTLHEPQAEVADSEVDARIDSILQSYAVPGQITDRAVADGDTVNIDYSGFKDGVAFDGGTAADQSLAIGSGQFIAGFEEGLVGAMPGDEVSLNLTFPEGYHSDELAGQAVVFEVKVNYIYDNAGAEIPAFTNEWVAGNSSFTTTEEYRSDLKAQMEAEAQSNAEAEKRTILINTVMGNAVISGVDEARVDAEYQEQSEYYEGYAANYGVEMADFIEMLGMTQEQFEAETRQNSENYVRTLMVMSEIGHRENLALTDEEKETTSKEYGYDSYQHFVDTYSQQKVDEVLLMEKVEKFLLANNNFEPVAESE